MSFLNTISEYAADYRARRRRLRTYKEITGLPREIQKDIGWPDAFEGSRFPSDAATRTQH